MACRWTLVALLACAIACTRSPVEEPNAFSWSEQLPPGSTLHIRNGSGTISVVASRGPLVKVVGGRKWRRGRARDIEFQVTRQRNDGHVFVCAMWRASGRCGESGYRGKRTETLLSFFSLFHRTTDATASFTVEVPAGVAIDASNTQGAVTIADVHAAVTAHTVSGAITALNLGGPVNLTTTNGVIRFTVDSLGSTDTVKASTINGIVHGELPAGTEATFDLSTVNGRVNTDFPLPVVGDKRRHSASGRIGVAERYVKLRAVNGTVALVKSASSDSGAARTPAAPQRLR